MTGEMRFDPERMGALSHQLSSLSARVSNQCVGTHSLNSDGEVAESIRNLDQQITKTATVLADLIRKTAALVEAGGALLESTDDTIGNKY